MGENERQPLLAQENVPYNRSVSGQFKQIITLFNDSLIKKRFILICKYVNVFPVHLGIIIS